MNDNLIALAVASVALAPFAWVLRQRWSKIRPLASTDIRWRLDAPDASPVLAKRYEIHGEWMATEWHAQFQQQGKRWLLRATDGQLEQLREAGWGDSLGSDGGGITRNQAMDLLMLAKNPELEDAEVLAFFDVHLEQPNALLFAHHASALRLDSDKMALWHERPATPLQKEGLRYFQGKVPRSITAQAAKDSLTAIERGLYQSGRAQEWTNWLRFSDTWQTLQAKEVCGQYDIKKPTPAKIRDAIQSLLDENVEEWSEKDVVVQRLVELYPELELRKDTALV